MGNQDLSAENGNLIFPGQVINLYAAGTYKGENIPIRSELYENTEKDLVRNPRMKEDRNTLTLSLISGSLAVFGKDQGAATGEILSKLYFGVGGKWKTNLSKDYALEFALDYTSLEIEEATSTTLINRDQDLKRIGIALGRDLSWLSLSAGYNLLDKVFYRTESSSSFRILTMINNQVYINGEKDFYNYNNSVVSFGLNTNFNKFNAPSGVDINTGFGYGAYLKYQKNRTTKNLSAILSYDTSSFESSDTELDFKSLTLRIDYEFDFFKGGVSE